MSAELSLSSKKAVLYCTLLHSHNPMKHSRVVPKEGPWSTEDGYAVKDKSPVVLSFLRVGLGPKAAVLTL